MFIFMGNTTHPIDDLFIKSILGMQLNEEKMEYNNNIERKMMGTKVHIKN